MLAFFWLLAIRLASLKPEPGACEHRPISLMLCKLQKKPKQTLVSKHNDYFNVHTGVIPVPFPPELSFHHWKTKVRWEIICCSLISQLLLLTYKTSL